MSVVIDVNKMYCDYFYYICIFGYRLAIEHMPDVCKAMNILFGSIKTNMCIYTSNSYIACLKRIQCYMQLYLNYEK